MFLQDTMRRLSFRVLYNSLYSMWCKSAMQRYYNFRKDMEGNLMLMMTSIMGYKFLTGSMIDQPCLQGNMYHSRMCCKRQLLNLLNEFLQDKVCID